MWLLETNGMSIFATVILLASTQLLPVSSSVQTEAISANHHKSQFKILHLKYYHFNLPDRGILRCKISWSINFNFTLIRNVDPRILKLMAFEMLSWFELLFWYCQDVWSCVCILHIWINYDIEAQITEASSNVWLAFMLEVFPWLYLVVCSTSN